LEELAEPDRGKVHSSVSEDLVKDVPDSGRTPRSVADELADTGRSSKAVSDTGRLSSVAEDVKSRSVSSNSEKLAEQRSPKSERQDYSCDESVSTEISSDAR